MAQLIPDSSLPGTRFSPPGSPVQAAFRWLQSFCAAYPRPDIGTDRATASGVLIAVHLLHLMKGCGILNGNGFHSCAVAMLRSMEDALDCFAAVTLVPGLAEQWEAGTLKASEAAKEWTSIINWKTPQGMSLSDYRKFLRRDFNNYSHCTNALLHWNLMFVPTNYDSASNTRAGKLEPNFYNMIINQNAHSIDVFEAAHLFEFLSIIRKFYSGYLSSNEATRMNLENIVCDLTILLEQHNKHGCQDVHSPPEVRNLK